MALIKCPECGKQMSDKAEACPHCGCPVEPKRFCPECGKQIEQNIKECPHCGYPFEEETSENEEPKKETKNNSSKYLLIGVCCLLVVVGIIVAIIIVSNSKKTLTCTYTIDNATGHLEYSIKYRFEDDEPVLLEGTNIAKPNDVDVAESLWKITHQNETEFNQYDGFTYKARYSEDHTITLEYSVDIKKAPTMFNAALNFGNVNNITTKTSREDIKEIYEDKDYICK